MSQPVKRHPGFLHDEESPAQLELFSELPARTTVMDPEAAAEVLTSALERGQWVALRRGTDGLELLTQPTPQEPCTAFGFSKRGGDVLVRCVERTARPCWAKPAGGGWAEWGLLTRWPGYGR